MEGRLFLEPLKMRSTYKKIFGLLLVCAVLISGFVALSAHMEWFSSTSETDNSNHDCQKKVHELLSNPHESEEYFKKCRDVEVEKSFWSNLFSFKHSGSIELTPLQIQFLQKTKKAVEILPTLMKNNDGSYYFEGLKNPAVITENENWNNVRIVAHPRCFFEKKSFLEAANFKDAVQALGVCKVRPSEITEVFQKIQGEKAIAIIEVAQMMKNVDIKALVGLKGNKIIYLADKDGNYLDKEDSAKAVLVLVSEFSIIWTKTQFRKVLNREPVKNLANVSFFQMSEICEAAIKALPKNHYIRSEDAKVLFFQECNIDESNEYPVLREHPQSGFKDLELEGNLVSNNENQRQKYLDLLKKKNVESKLWYSFLKNCNGNFASYDAKQISCVEPVSVITLRLDQFHSNTKSLAEVFKILKSYPELSTTENLLHLIRQINDGTNTLADIFNNETDENAQEFILGLSGFFTDIYCSSDCISRVEAKTSLKLSKEGGKKCLIQLEHDVFGKKQTLLKCGKNLSPTYFSDINLVSINQ